MMLRHALLRTPQAASFFIAQTLSASSPCSVVHARLFSSTHTTQSPSDSSSTPSNTPVSLGQQIIKDAERALKNKTRWVKGLTPSKDKEAGSQKSGIRPNTKASFTRPSRTEVGKSEAKKDKVKTEGKAESSALKEADSDAQKSMDASKNAYKTLRNHEWYGIRLQMLQEANEPLEALSVLESMNLVDRVRPTSFHYSVVMSSLAKGGHFNKCFSLYNDMKKRNLEVNDRTYVSLLNSCATCETKQVIHARNIVDDVKKKNGYISPAILGAALKVFIQSDLPQEAVNIFKEYKSVDVIKTVIQKARKYKGNNAGQPLKNIQTITKLYTIAMMAYVKTNDHEQIKELFEEYRSFKLQPDEYMYNNLIMGLSPATEDMGKFVQMMKADNIIPTPRTGMSLMIAHRNANQIDYIGRTFVKDLKRLGVGFDIGLYEAISSEYARNSRKPDLGPAKAILKQMQDDGIKPSLRVYTAFTQLALRLRNKAEACKFFEQLNRIGTADKSIYLGILKLLRTPGGSIEDGPFCKYGVQALLKLEALGHWSEEMNVIVPGKGRWTPSSKSKESLIELASDLRDVLEAPSNNNLATEPAKETLNELKEQLPEMEWLFAPSKDSKETKKKAK